MQPKVSIIIPCYNKADYIGNMLDSIIAQKWDNIEIVLVNDGSTDGTREIIAKYESKFIARGFEVVIHDQKNRGLPAAVYEGFRRVSGDYVCQVDADDELNPEYVRTMATWLLEHPDYDWVVCDLLYVYSDKEIHDSYFFTTCRIDIMPLSLAEYFLLMQIRTAVHEYMVRADYIKKSRLVENYYHDNRRTQEPQFVLPLAVAGGKLKHIPKPLYCYIQNGDMMSIINTHDDIVEYYEAYDKNVKATIDRLNINQAAKIRFVALAEITKCNIFFSSAHHHDLYENFPKDSMDERLLRFLKSAFPLSANWTKELLYDYRILYTALKDNVLKIPVIKPDADYSRIIAWGAFGKYGKSVLPYLRRTALDPTDLWDISGDGTDIEKPDVKSLSENDLVLVLPSRIIANEIFAELSESGCATLSYDEIWTYLSSKMLPEFYDGSIQL